VGKSTRMMESTTVRQRQEHRAVRLDPEHLISRAEDEEERERRDGEEGKRESEVLITWVNQLGAVAFEKERTGSR
jgi:hypothetical protein